MKLNLTIIGDYLEHIDIIYKKIRDPYEFSLVTVRLWQPEEDLSGQYLYLVRPEELPVWQRQDALSFICLGEAEDKPDRWEMLCVARDTDLHRLMNQILDLFVKFQDWDQRLMRTCYESCSLNALGNVGLEVFKNCISCWDIHERMLFISYSFLGTDLPFLYPRLADEYLDEDMRRILEKTPMYQQALKKKMPALYPAGTYETSTLYYNLFDQDIHLAHLGIEPFVRDFIPSDYSLIFHFGKYVKQALKKYNSFKTGGSREFDELLHKMLKAGSFSDIEVEKELLKYGWKMDGCYRCMSLRLSEEAMMVSLYGCMMFLMNLYPDIYIYKEKATLLVIFHQQSLEKEVVGLESLLCFLKKNNAYAGIGSAFNGFGQLKLYEHQAAFTLAAGMKKEPKKNLYQFDDYALDIMLEYGTKEMPVQVYFTDAFRSLRQYDQEKNAELVKTLRAYLKCNFNAAQTFKVLHIHKTTFSYRMDRIREISGMDLKQYRVRLYLMLLFENL